MQAALITLPTAHLMTATNPTTNTIPTCDPAKLADGRSKYQVVATVQTLMGSTGWTLNRTCTHVETLISSPQHSLHATALRFGKQGQPVGKAQIMRWVRAFELYGLEGLLDSRNGRTRAEYGWELRAMSLYNRPQKPSITFVVEGLQREGFENVTYNRVNSYLKKLGTDKAINSVERLGKQYARANARSYKSRDTEGLPVGFIYQGDGHTVDVYVAHPKTGGIFRPELTAWMDVRSRFIVGWWLSEAEDSTSTLYALSHALLSHNHVPAGVHIDNGSGYKSKLMSDSNSGYYARFGIEPMYALPYNSKGKGQIERFFGTLEGKFGKQWETFCGADMSAEVLNKITRDVKAGKRTLPSLEDYRTRLTDWINEYHHTPHRALNGKTPAEVWEGLERIPVVTPEAAVILPCTERSVSLRGELSLWNRRYYHKALLGHQRKKVLVHYSMHTDRMVRITDLNQHWICDAPLIEKQAYIPDARIEDLQHKRLKAQERRLEQQLIETRERAGLPVGHARTIENWKALEGECVDSSNEVGISLLLEDQQPDDEQQAINQMLVELMMNANTKEYSHV